MEHMDPQDRIGRTRRRRGSSRDRRRVAGLDLDAGRKLPGGRISRQSARIHVLCRILLHSAQNPTLRRV
jgi:hypothetical protein